MTRVTVITGAGGMGVPTAANLAADGPVVLFDNQQARLDDAASALAAESITPTLVLGDVTDPDDVDGLFTAAAALGQIRSVVHTAGVSPSMGTARYIARITALGTLTVNETLLRLADQQPDSIAEGAAVVNVASMAAHLIPAELIPLDLFPTAVGDPQAFVDALLTSFEHYPEQALPGLAYAVTKAFVKWYSSAQAERFSAAGIRIVSVSPGSIETEMGRLEAESGAGAMVEGAAIPRWGRPQEMADLFAFCVSDRAGYLTGTDILNDGGVVASMTERARAAALSG
ncbi:SDR family oxidoreductase [Gordonia sp. ABSL1-1]|uniref:SDR family oxidoreductase n=1 Tax=Gordonia sp. ABSL1-1 TaxID=3053923 RepID=UPI0025748E80|nr:SDR family oxidoreductase [Gordonia sp. ABSL1-1]MDL9937166.1 SDR family oxidoreductase [Gordonia sp. ABSL1-1]